MGKSNKYYIYLDVFYERNLYAISMLYYPPVLFPDTIPPEIGNCLVPFAKPYSPSIRNADRCSNPIPRKMKMRGREERRSWHFIFILSLI